jgi:hypothetical protein
VHGNTTPSLSFDRFFIINSTEEKRRRFYVFDIDDRNLLVNVKGHPAKWSTAFYKYTASRNITIQENSSWEKFCVLTSTPFHKVHENYLILLRSTCGVVFGLELTLGMGLLNE